MRGFLSKFIRLLGGLFVAATGMAFTLNAQIGYAPWDTLHVGIANTIGISIGTATISIGLLILVTALLLQEKIGLGTISNMIFVGLFIDLILSWTIIPIAKGLFSGIFMLLIGLFLISYGSYLYISSGFGAGPRDTLMIGLARRTKLPIGLCRGGVETLALFFGWKLGGMVGIGTVLSAFLIGFFIQFTFKLVKFDATQIKHQTLTETYQMFKQESNA